MQDNAKESGRLAFVVTLIVGLSVGLANQAHAQQTIDVQQTVEEFLKPQTTNRPPIYNFGSPENRPVPFIRECAQTNANQISCRPFVSKLQSGGGKMYGPWYIVTSDLAPIGYKFQSASFHLPAPDNCDGDDNSEKEACDPKGCGVITPGNPDTFHAGHKNGKGGHAVCFILSEDLNRVNWIYNLQGQEGGVSFKPYPFAKNDNLFEVDIRRDGTVSEPAELDVVYERIVKIEESHHPPGH